MQLLKKKEVIATSNPIKHCRAITVICCQSQTNLFHPYKVAICSFFFEDCIQCVVTKQSNFQPKQSKAEKVIFSLRQDIFLIYHNEV